MVGVVKAKRIQNQAGRTKLVKSPAGSFRHDRVTPGRVKGPSQMATGLQWRFSRVARQNSPDQVQGVSGQVGFNSYGRAALEMARTRALKPIRLFDSL